MMSLTRFYDDPENMRAVLPYIEQSNKSSGVSLRMIDWFVTNYTKKYDVFLPYVVGSSKVADSEDPSPEPSGGNSAVLFNVHAQYHAQLESYSKQRFDPFRRRERILLMYDGGTRHIQTTVGQLNFFRWLLQNRVLDFVVRNSAGIEADMLRSQDGGSSGRGRRARSIRGAADVTILSLDVKEDPAAATLPLPLPLPPPLPPQETVAGKCTRRRSELSRVPPVTMSRTLGVCTLVFD